MDPIELKLNENKRGAFVIDTDDERLAEMSVAISDGNLFVYHTHVSEQLQGKGVAGRLLERMVTYARENGLKVVALCKYVLVQFQRHEEEYKDIWNKNWHQ